MFSVSLNLCVLPSIVVAAFVYVLVIKLNIVLFCMSVLCKIDLVEETHTGKNCANRLMFLPVVCDFRFILCFEVTNCEYFCTLNTFYTKISCCVILQKKGNLKLFKTSYLYRFMYISYIKHLFVSQYFYQTGRR